MFVLKAAYQAALAERDEARVHAQHWRERATNAATYAGQLEHQLGTARAELAQLRQPRGAGGRFGAKVRP